MTEPEESRAQEDVGEVLTDTEQEIQEEANTQYMDVEEQDSIDTVTKKFGTMTTGITALATEKLS